MLVVRSQIFRAKNVKRKSTMQVFIYYNVRFCYQSKEKVLSSNTLGRMQIWTRKDKNGKSYDLEKSLSDESGSESDDESNE